MYILLEKKWINLKKKLDTLGKLLYRISQCCSKGSVAQILNPNIEACPRENGDPKQIQNANVQNLKTHPDAVRLFLSFEFWLLVLV